MNGKTEDSSGSRENKNTRMSYECRVTDNYAGLWLNFFDGGDSRSCASFFMTMPEAKAMITYLESILNEAESAKWREAECILAKNRRITDYQ